MTTQRQLNATNPRDGVADYTFSAAGPEEISSIAARLRDAQKDWQNLGTHKRGDILKSWATSLKQSPKALIEALSVDTGRRKIAEQEVFGFIAAIERWALEAPTLLKSETRPSSHFPSIDLESHYEPYPLVGIISPWNFPLVLSFIDAVPALMAGCAVLIKPSEVTPRFVDPLMRSLEAHETLKSVLHIIQGDGQTGGALIEHVDALSFTGSVATGRKVAEACARQFIPAYLELGGKDPAIVLETADIDHATTALLRGSVIATGQACQSIERIYVAEPIHTAFLDALTEKAKHVTLTDRAPDTGVIGPLIFGRQADIIEDHLKDAYAKGAKALTGGEILTTGGGRWIAPTVLTNVDHSMKVMTDETFGPVMPVMPFSSVEEAISLANDSLYGLSACVFAGATDEARAVAAQLNAGGISINDASLTTMVHEIEKNGFGFSGIGASRMGPTGLIRFTRQKAFFIQSGDPVPITAFDEAE